MVLLSNEQFMTVLEAIPTEDVGWEVEVVAPDDFSTVVARIFRFEALGGSKARNDCGSGSLTLPLSDAVFSTPLSGGYSGTILDREYLYRMYEDGVLRHEFFGEDVSEGILTADGSAAVEISGRSVERVLQWGVHVPAYSEVQVYSVGPEALAGDYRLRYGTEVTTPLAWDATAAQVQSALESLSGIGPANVQVEKKAEYDEADPPVLVTTRYFVTFVGVFLDWNVVAGALTVTDNTTRDSQENTLPTWNAATNAPLLKNADPPAEGSEPMTYRVTTAGTANFGTTAKPKRIEFAVHDHAEWDSNLQRWSCVKAADVPRPSVGVEETASVDAHGVSTGKPAGAAILEELARIQARGTLTYLTCLFSAEVDSFGVAWADVTGIEFGAGEEFFALLQRMAELLGWEFRLLPGFRLMVVQGGFGLHREEDVILWAGHNQIEQTRARTTREAATHVYGQGEGNVLVRATGASPAVPNPREVWVDGSGAGTVTDVQNVANKTFEVKRKQAVQRALTIPYGVQGARLFLDFGLGDFIAVEDEQYRRFTEKVVNIAWAVNSDGQIGMELVLDVPL